MACWYHMSILSFGLKRQFGKVYGMSHIGDRGCLCEVGIRTRWWLTVLLLRLPRWHVTEKLCGAVQKTCP